MICYDKKIPNVANPSDVEYNKIGNRLIELKMESNTE